MNGLVAVDMDRTLTRVDAVTQAAELACVDTHLDVEEFRATAGVTERNGESFQILNFVRQRLSPDGYELYKARFAEHGQEVGLLYEDAEPFLAYLRELGAGVLITTYGPDEWQKLKMQAAGLAANPYVITEQSRKGPVIASWKRDGLYRIHGMTAPHVGLVDDKLESFTGLPDDCYGYLLRRRGEATVPSQTRGEMRRGLRIVPSLLKAAEMIEMDYLQQAA